jgi:DNA-binding response OmpR family regulator
MNPEKIILIEDDPFIHNLYKDTLKAAGYNVVSAMDGEDGLNVIKNNTDASIILLDLIIPKISGLDVLKEIKKEEVTKNLSVIVLTNLSEGDIIKEALALGANAYLIKVDYTPRQVIEIVKQYIDLRIHLKKDQ